MPEPARCISQGDTREDAVVNLEEAIDLCIEVLKENGKPIPEDTCEAQVVDMRSVPLS
jgi:predicted RNase H-like HicB family nuclease